MTINERFAEILRVKNISVKEAAMLIEKSEGYVRKLMRAGESFGIEPVLLILNSIESVNADWLLRGKGEMFLTESHVVTTSPTSNRDIKILDIRVCAGHGIGFDGNENKVVGYVNIPEFVGCYGITVFGDSMYNMYMPGDIIFVREIKGKDMIDNGQPYVVITTEDRLLKMVYAEEDGLKLVSYNTVCNPDGRRKYPDMKIEGSQILHLYKVVGKLARTQM